MQVTVKPNKEKSQVEVNVSVPAEDFQIYIDRAAKKLTQNRPLPGFRPGKAPLSAALAAFGQERVLHEAMELSLSRFFVRAAVEREVEAINRPSVTVEKLGIGEAFEFTAIVDVLPEVKIKSLQNVKAERKKVEVQDKEVEEELKYLAKTREKKFEDIDDAFAKSLGKFSDLADLKQKLRESIQHEKEHKEEDRYRRELTEKLAEAAEFGFIPEVLFGREMNGRLRELRQILALQQRSLDDYLKEQKKTLEQVRSDMRPAAEAAVKIGLAIRAFAKDQQIEVPDEEIDAKLAAYADIKNVDMAALRDEIEASIRNQKALERLEEMAKVD